MNQLIIEGAEPGGQMMLTTEVENFPGFPTGIMGPELMDNMRKQAEQFGARFKRGCVTGVDLSEKPFQLYIQGEGNVETQALIISAIPTAKMLGIPGEQENIGRGISSCETGRNRFKIYLVKYFRKGEEKR